jgi:hypothetical protein
MQVAAQDFEVAADGDFRVFLDIGDAPAGSDLAVDLYDRIADERDLAASTTAEPAGEPATFDPIPLADAPAASQIGSFTIHLYGADDARPGDVPAAWSFRLEEPGVYPVRVRLRGPDDDELTSLVTYLVRRPDGGAEIVPNEVALLATVHQDPPLVAADAGTEPVDPSYLDALGELLATFTARPGLPASFAVTPETAERLAADPSALEALAALRDEVARPDRELTGAPYVDVDPTSLAGNGLTDELIRQSDLGARALTTALDLAEDPDRLRRDTWVVDRPVDAQTIDALASLGIAHLVLPDAATAPGTPPTVTPLPGRGGVDAVTMAPDDLASGAPTDPVLAGYQLLGRLAATASIEPGGAVTALRVDPLAVDPVELETVLDVLAEPTSHLRATTLSEAFADGPVAPVPAALTTPEQQSLGTYPELVNETHQLLTSYASMVPDQPESVQAFERPLARSAAVDLDLPTRRAEVRTQRDELRRRLGAVSVPERDIVTLGARDARFPLPITSSGEQPVRVVITLEASDRLTFPEDTIEATLTDRRTVVDIRVQTRATGDTPLRVSVRSPDGRVLAESRYTVRSTAVSGVGLVLTIGAAAFLALWWGRHWRRARRDRRAGVADAGRHRTPAAEPPPPDPEEDDDIFVRDPPATVGAEGASRPDVTAPDRPRSDAD